MDCESEIPTDAVILNQLHIIEYLQDGEIWKVDYSCGSDGEELSTAKYFELCEWARMIAMAPHIAEFIHDHVYDGDEDDE